MAPAPDRIYVIGDIHGHAELLDGMVSAIIGDLAARPVPDALTVTVGDYIDRGPDSRGVLERLARNPFPTRYVPLKGNHEEMLAAFLGDPTTMASWRWNGGLETLHSYGVDVGWLMRGRDYEGGAAALRVALPGHHRRFLDSLQLTLTVGRYFICHAGVRPGVPLANQDPEDLLWIREGFLNSRADFGKRVVHGHTPAPEPEVLPNRINVDTGAFMTGMLSCAVLEGAAVRFLSVS